MKDLFVPYELAVKLKEKGFNHVCIKYWIEHDNKLFLSNGLSQYEINQVNILAPLWQQVIDWLREYHMVNIVVAYDYETCRWQVKQQYSNTENELDIDVLYKDYYSALQSGIEKALELI